MEQRIAKYLDTIAEKYPNKKQAFNKIKEFIEIVKETGGLNNKDTFFVNKALTDENIKLVLESNVEFVRLYEAFTTPTNIRKTKSSSSFSCGTSMADRRKAMANNDRCGESIPKTDRCGEPIKSEADNQSAYSYRCGEPTTSRSC